MKWEENAQEKISFTVRNASMLPVSSLVVMWRQRGDLWQWWCWWWWWDSGVVCFGTRMFCVLLFCSVMFDTCSFTFLTLFCWLDKKLQILQVQQFFTTTLLFFSVFLRDTFLRFFLVWVLQENFSILRFFTTQIITRKTIENNT